MGGIDDLECLEWKARRRNDAPDAVGTYHLESDLYIGGHDGPSIVMIPQGTEFMTVKDPARTKTTLKTDKIEIILTGYISLADNDEGTDEDEDYYAVRFTSRPTESRPKRLHRDARSLFGAISDGAMLTCLRELVISREVLEHLDLTIRIKKGAFVTASQNPKLWGETILKAGGINIFADRAVNTDLMRHLKTTDGLIEGTHAAAQAALGAESELNKAGQ